jgi:hypothetical protein
MHEIDRIDDCILTSRNLLRSRERKNYKYNISVNNIGT